MMRCLLFCLLACAFTRSSGSAAEELPDWNDPPQVMQWIMMEHDWRVRRLMVESFFAQLAGEDFAECTDILWRNDGIQSGGHYGPILKLWAERHPKSARPVAELFVEIACDDHFSDLWEEKVRGPDADFLDALKNSPIWPQPYEVSYMLRGFVGDSGTGREQPDKWLIALAERFEERFGEEVKLLPDREEPELSSPFFADVVTILSCPLEQVYPMLKIRALDENGAARTMGWRRVAQRDPQDALRRDHCLPYVVIRTWAETDAEGLLNALGSLQSEYEDRHATSCLLAFGNQEIRNKVWSEIVERTAGEEYNGWAETLELLMQKEPELALAMLPALKMNEDSESYFRDLLIVYGFQETSEPEVRDRLRKILLSHQPLIADDPAYILMETWGDFDVGEAARFGVTWHLASIEQFAELSGRLNWRSWDKEHLVDVWSGKVMGPSDSSMDDRTFGTLRKWALCQPGEMAAWIDTLEDAEIRSALHWMREHAAGGFVPPR